MGKQSISAASVRVKSNVKAIGVYPKSSKTASIHLTTGGALDLAAKLILLARDETTNNPRIKITGHTDSNHVTVIRDLKRKGISK